MRLLEVLLRRKEYLYLTGSETGKGRNDTTFRDTFT